MAACYYDGMLGCHRNYTGRGDGLSKGPPGHTHTHPHCKSTKIPTSTCWVEGNLLLERKLNALSLPARERSERRGIGSHTTYGAEPANLRMERESPVPTLNLMNPGIRFSFCIRVNTIPSVDVERKFSSVFRLIKHDWIQT